MVNTKQQIPMAMLVLCEFGMRENPTLGTETLRPILSSIDRSGLIVTELFQSDDDDVVDRLVKKRASSALLKSMRRRDKRAVLNSEKAGF